MENYQFATQEEFNNLLARVNELEQILEQGNVIEVHLPKNKAK